MREALRLAEKGAGRTSPNPAVGAHLVKDGRIIARGFHKKAGGPHAEAACLLSLKRKGRAAYSSAKGATMYVTLEPCCHYGRTPPCTEAIISAGVKTVVVGAYDPNPIVAGKGISRLKAAGIKVVAVVREKECRALNVAYEKYITTGLPYVTLKLASSLDGRIAANGGDSKWITGEASRRRVHLMRSRADAVLVGSATASADDPELTTRLVKGLNPARVLIDTSFQTPLSAKMFKHNALDRGRPMVFTTSAASEAKIKKAGRLGIDVLIAPLMRGRVGLSDMLKALGQRGITSLLVEGGGAVAASFLNDKKVDAIALFFAPIVLGAEGIPSVAYLGIKKVREAIRFKDMKASMIGKDLLVEAKPDISSSPPLFFKGEEKEGFRVRGT
ncbi:MAG: bifunctional diaminohydroxyphosphoribosylaminopyrimidine deaminase/5-amino-6-(5-phosphoribosylamino)uracil reductase RibD [Deltaproteobacteria bacterium]|nr:bifunctional diaminohydroxyphosphoribosylaminopyrimidine deaminase/5-amino-6-(5-phosphoribosylamino)uracil reductase RibD [Deltaproteobacteria bacterium]